MVGFIFRARDMAPPTAEAEVVATARSQCQSAMRADLAALLSTASHDRALAERGALVVYSLVALSEAELDIHITA